MLHYFVFKILKYQLIDFDWNSNENYNCDSDL